MSNLDFTISGEERARGKKEGKKGNPAQDLISPLNLKGGRRKRGKKGKERKEGKGYSTKKLANSPFLHQGRGGEKGGGREKGRSPNLRVFLIFMFFYFGGDVRKGGGRGGEKRFKLPVIGSQPGCFAEGKGKERKKGTVAALLH